MQGSANQKNQIDREIKKGHFLQSKEWGEFQRALGREVFRVDDILATKLPLAFGKNYLYSAGVKDLRFKILDLRKIAEQENAIFLKFEPMMDDKRIVDELLRAGFVKSNKEIQPQKTLVLDLTKSEDELLKGMRHKTRYNARLAIKQGLKIINPNYQTPNKSQLPNSKNETEAFWELLKKTAKRDEFSSHTKEYYEKFLELTIAQLFTAEYRGKIVAANIILFYGNTAYYLHGASDYEYRNLMAPYLLHWETIKYAKEKGFKKYDFWGADEKKWPGVTRFKRGFGGKEIEYAGSYDYIFQPFWYRLYALRNYVKQLLHC